MSSVDHKSRQREGLKQPENHLKIDVLAFSQTLGLSRPCGLACCQLSCLPGRHHTLHTGICPSHGSPTWSTPSMPSTLCRLAHPPIVNVRFTTATNSCPPTWPASRSTSWPTARRA